MAERKGYYSMGLAGYEVWPDPENHEKLMARFVGTEKEHPARSYKIQETRSGKMFIRPDGRRIYLDEILVI